MSFVSGLPRGLPHSPKPPIHILSHAHAHAFGIFVPISLHRVPRIRCLSPTCQEWLRCRAVPFLLCMSGREAAASRTQGSHEL